MPVGGVDAVLDQRGPLCLVSATAAVAAATLAIYQRLQAASGPAAAGASSGGGNPRLSQEVPVPSAARASNGPGPMSQHAGAFVGWGGWDGLIAPRSCSVVARHACRPTTRGSRAPRRS